MGGLGLAGNSQLLLLFFIIFHQGHLQLTPSKTLLTHFDVNYTSITHEGVSEHPTLLVTLVLYVRWIHFSAAQ